jgi:hypothetical protein
MLLKSNQDVIASVLREAISISSLGIASSSQERWSRNDIELEVLDFANTLDIKQISIIIPTPCSLF